MKHSGYGILFFLITVVAAVIGAQFLSASRTPGLAAGPEQPVPAILVFAAAGTAAPMQELAELYDRQNNTKTQLNLASSATLAKQITAGAEWDVFISANLQWMDYVLEESSLNPDTVVNLLKDRLTLVAPADGEPFAFSIEDNSFATHFKGHLALGDPASVPAGIYARKALEKLGWWQDLSDNIIPAVDVAAARRYVESGQCQAGIVYLSGVKDSSKLKLIHIFDEALHDPIYFVAVANSNSRQGKLFLDFLAASPQAAKSFEHHGFEIVGSSKDTGR